MKLFVYILVILSGGLGHLLTVAGIDYSNGADMDMVYNHLTNAALMAAPILYAFAAVEEKF